MIIEWNEDAIADFDDIYLNLKRIDIIYAENFTEAIFSKIDQIQAYPMSGKVFPQLDNTRIREIITNRYRIVYFVKKSDLIEILAIVHTRQNIRL